MQQQPFMTLQDYETRDPWWEARQMNAAYGGSRAINFASQLWRVVARPKAKHQFGTLESVMAIDLNSYRPDINVELLIDQGVRVFMLRVVCPGRWEYGNWQYFVDSTFTTYHKRIRDYAKAKGITVWICGYGVHNPWSNEQSGYNGPDPQVALLKEATRNHLCDFYSWDDEVAECYRNGGNVVMTSVNLVKSISSCMEQTWSEFERNPDGTHKMVLHYSANWYMKKYAQEAYTVWLDNSNTDVNTRHMMTWRAWVPVSISTAFDAIRAFFDKWIIPTGMQENAYLRLGSNLAADFWQGCFTTTGPWCPKKADGSYAYGIDSSISYGPSATLAKFAYNANLSYAQGDTEPPTAPGGITASYVKPAVIVTWTSATDNIEVVGYRVKRNGAVVGNFINMIYTDASVSAGQTYLYEVDAFDKAGNYGPAVSATVTIPNVPPPSDDFITREEFDGHIHETGGPVIKS